MTKFLDYVSKKYYQGNPLISDDQFDALASYHNYQKVGAAFDQTIEHSFRLYSLNKFYDKDKAPVFQNPIQSVKLDGLAISLLYLYGKYTMALTRGDGKRGLDITEKVRHLVPQILVDKLPCRQINGQVVAPKTIPNSRNYASGALGLKNIDQIKQKQLYFVAYGVQPNIGSTWTEDLHYLTKYTFNTVLQHDLSQNFPCDGLVIRQNSNELFKELGHTSKHPRGAYALKTQKQGVITKLLDVVWQVGRTGVVSPVAILQPVIIGQARVSKATLHNPNFIKQKDLQINCLVQVVRSGQIIPKINRRIYET